MIDLRTTSAICDAWIGAKLTAENCYILYIPSGYAHGFLPLDDETEVYYPAGIPLVRCENPAFGIVWPEPVLVISNRDRSNEFIKE